MKNNKITKIGIGIAVALIGGVNYFSFSDMGNNIDTHIVKPLKISMENNRIKEEQDKKQKEDQDRINEEIRSKNIEAQLIKQKEENKRITLLLKQKADQNEKIIQDMNRLKNHPVSPVVNYTIPNTNNGNNITYMTAFGISSAAETVKEMAEINSSNYLVYKDSTGSSIFAVLNINPDNKVDYKGLLGVEDKRYTKIMISQSGQQYLYEDRCKNSLGEDKNWLKIIPDSPSVLTKSNQICSLLPIIDKNSIKEKENKALTDNSLNITKDSPIIIEKTDEKYIDKNLQFDNYKNVIKKSINHYSYAGKSGNISFNINSNGIIENVTNVENNENYNKLNEYYNSVMISADKQEIFVYNKLCPINFYNKNMVVEMGDNDGHEQYFITNENGFVSKECAILPLKKSNEE